MPSWASYRTHPDTGDKDDTEGPSETADTGTTGDGDGRDEDGGDGDRRERDGGDGDGRDGDGGDGDGRDGDGGDGDRGLLTVESLSAQESDALISFMDNLGERERTEHDME